MSGLEPLAALGLACNILQIVDVGRQTITLIKTTYRDGAPDTTLADNAEILRTIAEKVETRPSNPSGGRTKPQRQLLEAAGKCLTAARDLQEEVNFLVGTARKGNLISALKVAAKTNWRRRRLDRLKESLDNAERLMQTGLLERIWSNTTHMQLNLESLDSDLRLFIAQLQNNHRTTQELITREAMTTRQKASSATVRAQQELQHHLSHELSQSELNIKGQFSSELRNSTKEIHTRLSRLSLTITDATKRDRLLHSLKYSGFNERRNQVREAHSQTFRWIFSGDDDNSYKSTDMQWDSFSNWLKSTGNFYWISGKPGSGKTTLVKYVLSDSQTTQYLDVWEPGAVLISHFFWKPGSQMQRDIKGLLCSLNFQLLSRNETAFDFILSKFPEYDFKESDTDWSVKELRSVCMQSVAFYEHPICLFLDGLDEYDDPHDTLSDLLDLLNQLSRSGRMKICVASRPEPLIRKHLQSLPQLRLQDLTGKDRFLYAKEHVKMPKEYDIDEIPDLISLLVNKSEGVFLWLVLAIQNVNRGFELDDDRDIIYKRIDALPNDLTLLYHEMWKRATHQDPMECRQRAALYLKIVLQHKERKEIGDGLRHLNMFVRPDVLNMLMWSSSISDRLLGKWDEPFLPKLVPAAVLLQGCRKIEKEVEHYTAGLIELVKDETSLGVNVSSWEGGEYDTLLPYTRYQSLFRFIHRTAYDFLIDTAEGQEILIHDPTSASTIIFRFYKASMARCRIFCSHLTDMEHPVFHNSVVSHLHAITSLLHDDESEAWDRSQVNPLLLACERLCTARRLFAGRQEGYARPCIGLGFLSAASVAWLDALSLSTIQKLDLDVKKRSEVLLHFFNHTWIPWISSLQVEPLLRRGVDPNWKGICFDPVHRSWDYLESPFTACIRFGFMAAGSLPNRTRARSMFLMVVKNFLSNGADLQDKIGIVLGYQSREEPLSSVRQDFFMHDLRDLGRLGLRESLWRARLGIIFMPAYAVLDALIETIHLSLSDLDEECVKALNMSLQRHVHASPNDGNYGLIFLDEDEQSGSIETRGYTELPFAENPREIIQTLLRDGIKESRYRHDNNSKASQHVQEGVVSTIEAASRKSIKGDVHYLQRLEELGLATRNVGDVRSMDEWVLQAREESIRALS